MDSLREWPTKTGVWCSRDVVEKDASVLLSSLEKNSVSGFRFPKSSRLLKSSDFQFQGKRRFVTSGRFRFVFSEHGFGRLGLSISKKVLPRAVARNRVKRLLREAFRLQSSEIGQKDLHVIGIEGLRSGWRELSLNDVISELSVAALKQIKTGL